MREFSPAALVVHREATGLTQSALARQCGLSQGQISEMERGEKKPRPEAVRKVAAGLGIPTTCLLSPLPDEIMRRGPGHEFDPVSLTTLREVVGLSQAALALRTGLSQGHISEIERGDKQPRPSTVLKLAYGLGVPARMVWASLGSVAHHTDFLAAELDTASSTVVSKPDVHAAAQRLFDVIQRRFKFNVNGPHPNADRNQRS